MAGKLTGDLSVPKDVANNMTFTYDELLKVGLDKNYVKTKFLDTIFRLY